MSFVDPKKLALLASKVAEGEQPSEELVGMFYVLARSLFRGYTNFIPKGVVLEQDDAVQEAVLACCKAATKFDIEKSNGSGFTFFRKRIVFTFGHLRNYLTRACRYPKGKIESLDAMIEAGEDFAMPAYEEPTHCLRRDYLWHTSRKRPTSPPLTDDQRAEVVDLVEGGLTIEEAAVEFGVEEDVIHAIMEQEQE